MARTNLTVSVQRTGGVCVLAVGGELDVVSSAEFAGRVAAAVDDRTERLILDLAGLTFVDGCGARAIAAVRHAVPGECPVIVRSAAPAAWRVFDLLGLSPEDRRRADTRTCEQCGTAFAPRREHARFCCARCRIAWNRENTCDGLTGIHALDWSITAMRDATAHLRGAAARDRARALAAISEAVWWVTIVDGTLVRYHPAGYDAVLEAHTPADRQLIEETLSGLRFVRNRMGHYLDPVDFIAARAGSRAVALTAWTWKPVPEPALASLPARGQAWEMTRYRAYQARLAGHAVGDIFDRAEEFLSLVARQATSATGPGLDSRLATGA